MDEETKKIIDQVKLETDVFNKAKFLNFLKKEKNFSVIQLAKNLGMTPSYVCHLLRLLRLPEIVVDGYYSKIISISHLMTLSRLKNKEDIVALYEEVLSKNLTVVKTDELLREKLYRIQSDGERIDEGTKKKIEEKYKKIDKDLEVKITQTRIQTKLTLTIRGGLRKTTEVLKKLGSS